MRWLKHLSHAHSDPEVDKLLERFGAVGYGVYWLVLEDIASQMDAGRMIPEATHSRQRWSQITRTDPRVCMKILQTLSEHLVELVHTEDGRICIAAPKLLKYKDEYSKKSGVTPENVPPRTDREQIENRTDTEKKETSKEKAASLPLAVVGAKPARIVSEFEEDWPKFWLRVGKEAALRAYRKARAKASREEIMAAVVRLGPLITVQAEAQCRSPVHPATWLNAGRWRDEEAAYAIAQAPLALARGEPKRKPETAFDRMLREAGVEKGNLGV